MAYFLLVLFFLFFISFLYSSFPPHLLLIELSLCTLAGSLQRPIESSSLCFSSASLILSVWITCPLKVTKRFLVLYFSLLYFLSKLLLFPFLISLLLLIFLPFALLYLFPLCPLSLLKFCFIWIQPFLSFPFLSPLSFAYHWSACVFQGQSSPGFPHLCEIADYAPDCCWACYWCPV